jgi:hypothetical protein
MHRTKLKKDLTSPKDSIKELEERESKMYWQKEGQDEFLDKKEDREHKLLKRNKIGGED